MTRLCNKGFTLIELLVAAAILVIVLGALLHLFNYCLALSMQAGNVTFATAEAYGKLEEIRLYAYSKIKDDYDGNTFDLTQLNGSGEIDIIDASGDGELLQVEVAVDYNEKGRIINLPLVSMIAER